jgi:hypothetical protein
MSLGYQIVVAVVYTFAVARVVRLINDDVIFDPVRLWVAGHAAWAGRIADNGEGIPGLEEQSVVWRGRQRRWNTAVYWLGCPWCVSIWVAAFTVWVPFWHHGNPVAQYVGAVLAVSHVVGVASRWSSDEELEIVDADDVNGR